MRGESEAVKSFFSSIQVHLSPVWLESCINWCKSETLSPNHTLEELQSKIYEQWLLLDLREVEFPCLPPNLSTQQHFTLTGNFCLQMMQICDISKPKLWQLQKIHNSHALTKEKDSDVAGTGKRMLQMTLTDGVQEVEAMEYTTIACLSLNLCPGTKVRIIGPVVIRRGRLMLKAHNVKILGGEVEELLVSHAVENVLARALKMEENPNPAVVDERTLVVEKEETNEGYINVSSIAKAQKPSQQQMNERDQKPPQRQIHEHMMDDDIDMLLQAEEEIRNSTAQDFRSIPKIYTSTQVQPSFTMDDDDDVFKEIDIDGEAVQPLHTIAALLQDKHVTKTVYKIRAKFKCVEEKLTVANGEYNLAIRVADASGDIVVKVHTDVIAEYAGCSAAHIINLKNNVLGDDQGVREEILRTIMKVKEKLQVMDAEMMVEVEKDKRPIVTKVM